MASSTFGVAGPLTGYDEKGLEKVRRSRLSLHMQTRHVRRWLLVQLVSVPVDEMEGAGSPQQGQTLQAREHAERDLSNLTTQYHVAQPTRTWM